MIEDNGDHVQRILLAHGSGGELSQQLVQRLFLRHFSNPILARLDDAATFGLSCPTSGSCREADVKLAFTTDSYVVSPIFFPGGDIGKLAVCGTINDLAMSGARPLYLSAGFILEEGLLLADLERVTASMAATVAAAAMLIVAGDTKVVERGKADQIFINTAGLGLVPVDVDLGSHLVRPGDAIIVSGSLGDHGMTIMSQREGLRFSSPLESDCAPLHGLVAAMLEGAPQAIHCLRDPTRGGLATVLNEVAAKSGVGVHIDEEAIPVKDAVRAACELLGLDPLYVANEGKLVAFVAPQDAERLLSVMRAHELGEEATIIGRATGDHAGRVVMSTALGARRVVDMLVGEQLPRIC